LSRFRSFKLSPVTVVSLKDASAKIGVIVKDAVDASVAAVCEAVCSKDATTLQSKVEHFTSTVRECPVLVQFCDGLDHLIDLKEVLERSMTTLSMIPEKEWKSMLVDIAQAIRAFETTICQSQLKQQKPKLFDCSIRPSRNIYMYI
jgi:hypothetical protein